MPTARRTIAEFQTGEHLEDAVLLVNDKDFRTTARGSQYIHAVLADSSGQIVARMWDANQALFDSMPTGGLMRFRGRVEAYKGKPQFVIEGMRAVEPGTLDPGEFLPRTEHDIDALWARLKEILREIKDPDLLALIAKFINDDDFAQRFQRSPAAMALHHAYIGGLLEHTVGVLELALLVMPRYPDVSQDLVLAGIFFHDAAKTRELEYETSIGYSNEGQLLGHIVMCVTWIHEAARAVEQDTGQPFPEDKLNVLKHIVTAHHGQYEFGSPKLPAVPEAVAVHYLDNLDAKLAMFRHHIANDPDESREWTGFIPALQSKLYKTDVMRPQE
jgi:3'-5' exoribonuclease